MQHSFDIFYQLNDLELLSLLPSFHNSDQRPARLFSFAFFITVSLDSDESEDIACGSNTNAVPAVSP